LSAIVRMPSCSGSGSILSAELHRLIERPTPHPVTDSEQSIPIARDGRLMAVNLRLL
jgi:hypothetical protein